MKNNFENIDLVYVYDYSFEEEYEKITSNESADNSNFSEFITVEKFKFRMAIHSIGTEFSPNPKEYGYLLNDNGVRVALISPEICSFNDITKPVVGLSKSTGKWILFNSKPFDAIGTI